MGTSEVRRNKRLWIEFGGGEGGEKKKGRETRIYIFINWTTIIFQRITWTNLFSTKLHTCYTHSNVLNSLKKCTYQFLGLHKVFGNQKEKIKLSLKIIGSEKSLFMHLMNWKKANLKFCFSGFNKKKSVQTCLFFLVLYRRNLNFLGV